MSTAYEQALEALELVAGVPEVRGGVFVLDQQDMDFVRKTVDALRAVEARWDAVVQLASELDDAAQHITERQAYNFATRLRLLAEGDSK